MACAYIARELLACLGERVAPDDVVAEVRADDRPDLARLQRRDGRRELRHHRLRREDAEVTAGILVAGSLLCCLASAAKFLSLIWRRTLSARRMTESLPPPLLPAGNGEQDVARRQEAVPSL